MDGGLSELGSFHVFLVLLWIPFPAIAGELDKPRDSPPKSSTEEGPADSKSGEAEKRAAWRHPCVDVFDAAFVFSSPALWSESESKNRWRRFGQRL